MFPAWRCICVLVSTFLAQNYCKWTSLSDRQYFCTTCVLCVHVQWLWGDSVQYNLTAYFGDHRHIASCILSATMVLGCTVQHLYYELSKLPKHQLHFVLCAQILLSWIIFIVLLVTQVCLRCSCVSSMNMNHSWQETASRQLIWLQVFFSSLHNKIWKHTSRVFCIMSLSL